MAEEEEDKSEEEMLVEALKTLSKGISNSTRIVIDTPMLKLLGLTAAIYILNPERVAGEFLAFFGQAFDMIARGVANGTVGALGDLGDWLKGLFGG